MEYLWIIRAFNADHSTFNVGSSKLCTTTNYVQSVLGCYQYYYWQFDGLFGVILARFVSVCTTSTDRLCVFFKYREEEKQNDTARE